MKDTFYFSHDYNARCDDKIKPLVRKYGMLGYGIFWAIVEDLYNNANALRMDYEGIAYDLHCEVNIIKSIINDFDLFKIDANLFGSMSVQKRLDERDSKSEKARESARKRWAKDANALPPQSERIELECEGNAIKERKERNKEKEINMEFENFRTKYLGTKRGHETEFKDFKKHSDWKEINPTLENILIKQIEAKNKEKEITGFTPAWKNLKTWLNQRCWEDEISISEKKTESIIKDSYLNLPSRKILQ